MKNTDDLGVRLYENGDYWKAYWIDPAGREHSKSLGSKDKVTKRQALQKCHALATQHIVQPSTMTGGKAPTLKAWTDHYLKTRTDLSEQTRTLYGYTIEYMSEYFGDDTRIDAIDKFSARAWRSWLGQPKDPPPGQDAGKGQAESTVCLHVRAVKAIFNMALDDEIIARNPFAKLNGSAPEIDKTWPELSDDDIQRLVNAAPSPQWKAMVGLCAWAGLRRGEAIRLTWQDIQWERNRLTVRNPEGHVTSKKRTRGVLMVEPLAKLLLDVQETTTSANPANVAGANLNRTMKKIIKKAGFTVWDKKFHALRKSRATTWRAKYPEPVVDAWLGHSLDVARKHYTKVPEQFYGADELTKAKAEIDRLAALVERMKKEQEQPAAGK